jgi:hypothetical protein
MSLYQFVFRETPKGKAQHDGPPPLSTHIDRRAHATEKGPVIGVIRQGDVCENNIGGSWHYTWIVEAPDIAHVTAFLQECVLYGFVELCSGPTPVLTEKDSLEIKKLHDELRAAFPDG